MGKTMSSLASPAVAVDYDATLIMPVEISNKSWVVAAHVPGLGHIKAKQTIGPTAEALATSIEGYRRRAAASGRVIDRVIVIYEAGYGGFWLARWQRRTGLMSMSSNHRAFPWSGASEEQNRIRSTPSLHASAQ